MRPTPTNCVFYFKSDDNVLIFRLLSECVSQIKFDLALVVSELQRAKHTHTNLTPKMIALFHRCKLFVLNFNS